MHLKSVRIDVKDANKMKETNYIENWKGSVCLSYDLVSSHKIYISNSEFGSEI